METRSSRINDNLQQKLKSKFKKEIVSNMQSVINSVKKKKKHKRKKEQLNKTHTEITNISDILSNSLTIVSPETENINNLKSHIKIGPAEIQLDANIDLYKSKERSNFSDNIVSTVNGKSNNNKGDKFKKGINKNIELDHNIKEAYQNGELKHQNNLKLNAFQLMMNARNHSIGSNASGKELLSKEKTVSEEMKKVTAKRRLILQEWANKKGCTKRKLEEEERQTYIEVQLGKRAKRFKRMLLNDESISTKLNCSTVTEINVENNSKKIKKTKKTGSKTIVVTDYEDDFDVDTDMKKKSLKRNCNNSSDSDISNTMKETDLEFIKKLSSPIKKRDNLLRYFQTKENIDEISINSKQVTKTKRKISNSSGALELLTPTRRSKGNRTRKSFEKYDLKLNADKSKKVLKSMESDTEDLTEDCINDNSLELIVFDETIDNLEMIDKENAKDSPSLKLAPVFIKKTSNLITDPVIIKARHEFLMSSFPDTKKFETNKQRDYDETNLDTQFPVVSHVLQWNEDEYQSISKQISKIISYSNLKDFDSQNKICINNERDFTFKSLSGNQRPIVQYYKPLSQLRKIENKITILKYLKASYGKFPTYKCYNQLRKKYKTFNTADLQQLSAEPKINNNKFNEIHILISTNVNLNEIHPNEDLLFTEKYKPLKSEQVLVNTYPVDQLKSFLSSWQNARITKSSTISDDFYSGDDSYNSLSGLCNSVVLFGPCASGKTNAVFALANEMNFKILEINAGMKRTGKRILQDLQEATQSHQVSKDTNNGNLFKTISSKNNKKYPAQNWVNSSSSSSELSSNEKMCLILIEDADIIFDQDSGFIDAIHQLVTASKRPVIITSNNPNCSHLSKLMSKNLIEFRESNSFDISKFLSILSLVENCPIAINDIENLYKLNKNDLRKTLLEIQFFIQSGGDRKKNRILKSGKIDMKSDDYENFIHRDLLKFYTINQNQLLQIPFPIHCDILRLNLNKIFICDINELQKREISKVNSKNHNLQDLGNFFENLSVISQLQPNDADYIQGIYLNDTISYTLLRKTLSVNLGADISNYESLKDSTKRVILSEYLPRNYIRSSKSVGLDYEPCLRSICRSEKIRSLTERRGSRFYHYLRNMCINTKSFSTDIFDNVWLGNEFS